MKNITKISIIICIFFLILSILLLIKNTNNDTSYDVLDEVEEKEFNKEIEQEPKEISHRFHISNISFHEEESFNKTIETHFSSIAKLMIVFAIMVGLINLILSIYEYKP